MTSKRRIEDDIWDGHKDELFRLYELESESLPSIMKHMESHHRFVRSKPQYQRAFQRWKFKKRNISKAEWSYIEAAFVRRETSGKHRTGVRIHGVSVPDAKVRKQRRNYTMTMTEKQTLLLIPSSAGPAAPPGVEIYTPKSPSPASVYGNLLPYQASELEAIVPISKDVLFYCANRTPWRHFMRLFNAFNVSMSSDRVEKIPRCDVALITPSLSISSLFEDKIEFLFMSLYVDFGYHPHPALFDPRPYLPAHEEYSTDFNLEGCRDLSPQGRQIELLKHAVYLSSNNFDTWEIPSSIVELVKEPQNLQFLARFLRSDLATAKVMTEKLLVPAVRGNNLPLLHMLLDSGGDINYHDSFDTPLLGIAIESRNSGLVASLLERGADLRMEGCRFVSPSTSVRMAVRSGDYSIVKHLFRRLQKSSGSEDMENLFDTSVFISAASQGNVAMLNLLASHLPRIYKALRQTPWILYEAAAYGCQLAMLDALRAKGFDLSAKSKSNQASPLVYAIFENYSQIVEYLLKEGSDISAYASGVFKIEIRTYQYRRSWAATDQTKWAPIHCAAYTGNFEVLRHLLSRGADPNQPGIRFPVQLAAGRGKIEAARLLLEAGADVNAVALPSTTCFYDILSFDIFENGARQEYTSFSAEISAIQIALEKGDANLFDLFLEYGAQLPTGPPRSHIECINGDPAGCPNCTCEGFADKIETIWNPLLNAAFGANHSLFSRILEIAIADGRPWMTNSCLTACIKKFEWDFVENLINEAMFPPCPDYQTEILLRSAKEGARSEGRFRDALHTNKIGLLDTVKILKCATESGALDIVQLLLETGSWPDDGVRTHSISRYWGAMRSNTEPASALEVALKNANGPILSLMLDHYRNVMDKAQEPAVKTHFMQAYGIAIIWEQMDMITLLAGVSGLDSVLFPVRIDSDLEFDPTITFTSATQLAAVTGQYKVLRWLLVHDVDVNLRAGDEVDHYLSNSCLQIATRDGELLVVKKLLEKGADVNASPARVRGATAIQFAAIEGRFDLVDLLISAGADINASPGYFEGRTAIEGAAERGRLDMVSYLLELGADVLGKDNVNYKRTVYRAYKEGHHALARMVYKWKTEHDGLTDDSDRIEVIMATMKEETLKYAEIRV